MNWTRAYNSNWMMSHCAGLSRFYRYGVHSTRTKQTNSKKETKKSRGRKNADNIFFLLPKRICCCYCRIQNVTNETANIFNQKKKTRNNRIHTFLLIFPFIRILQKALFLIYSQSKFDRSLAQLQIKMH